MNIAQTLPVVLKASAPRKTSRGPRQKEEEQMVMYGEKTVRPENFQ